MGEEEVKHTCTFCGKNFKNIRALCGHKRSHSSANNSTKRGQKKHESELGFEGKHQPSCDFGANSKEKGCLSNFCQKCGKGFKSLRALHVHMRLHSKRKVVKPLSVKDLKLPNYLPKEKRSVRRYKINTCSINCYSCSNWNKFTDKVGTTSSVGIVHEEELKDIASCLLMLAKGGFYSDNNVSVVDSEMMTQQCQVDAEPSCNHTAGGDIVMEEVRVEDSRTNFDDCMTRQECAECGPNFDFHSDSELYITQMKEESTDFRPLRLFGYELIEDTKSKDEKTQVGSIFGAVLDSNTCDHGIKETKCSGSLNLKHICKICKRGFRSHQALGGHRLHCPRSKRSCTGETHFHSETVEMGSDQRKKRLKNFMCSVCCKAFSSGQALGGHMRAHIPGNSQSCEKKNDAFDDDISGASEGKIGLNHVLNPHSLPALVPMA